MKKHSIHHICLLFILFAISLSSAAQPPHQKRFDPKEYRAHLEAAITKSASLTHAEAQKFFPLFHEMKEKQLKISRQIMDLKRNKPAAGTNEKEYANIVQKIQDLNVEMAQIGASYHKRMCKEIPAHKVYEAILAEDDFHRTTLSRFNERGNNIGNRNGGPRGENRGGKRNSR